MCSLYNHIVTEQTHGKILRPAVTLCVLVNHGAERLYLAGHKQQRPGVSEPISLDDDDQVA